MTRARRIDIPGARHHVINRGVDRGTIFFCDADRIEFGRLLGEIHDRYGIRVLAYCLMDNHFHLVVHAPDGRLSEAMQYLTGTFARHVNERAGRTGHLFGSRFFASLIVTDRYLLTAIRYVERNALDVPGVDRVDEYRWSSHRAHSGAKRGPEWLDTDAVLMYFADTDRYRRFVRAPGSSTEPDSVEPSIVDYSVHLAIDELKSEEIAAQQLDRVVKLLMLDELGTANRSVLITDLGFESEEAVASARRRAEKRAASVPPLRHMASRALALVFDAHASLGQAQTSAPGAAA